MNTQLRNLLLPLLLGLFALPVKGQGFTKSTKQKRTVFNDSGVGLTVEAEIVFRDENAPAPPHQVGVKYIYNGKVSPTDRYVLWKMRYITMDGYLKERQFSAAVGGGELRGEIGEAPTQQKRVLDEPFECQEIIDLCFDIATASTARSWVKDLLQSIDPDSIAGTRILQPGQATTLTVAGGGLAAGARWVWYADGCGTEAAVGQGRTLVLAPKANTTYFVRSESRTATGKCVSAFVRVDGRSVAPTAISGSQQMCVGETTTLSVVGGGLGQQANWVWYSDKCGGNRLGTGTTLVVQPARTTTYFVRAEGALNTTSCATITVTTHAASPAPTTIELVGNGRPCAGAAGTLRVQGPDLPAGVQWIWYANNCAGTSLGRGATLPVAPATTTTYFVRAEGGCNTSTCAQLTVNVPVASQAAYGIGGTTSAPKRELVTLNVQGGQLGTDAQWKWYANTCNSRKLLGEGESIQLRLRRPMTVFAKAVGPCGETSCVSTQLTPTRRPWQRQYVPGAFFHFGYGVGLDYQRYAADIVRRYDGINGSVTDTVARRFSGFGIRAEATFHPIIKPNYSLALRSSAAIGTGLYALLADTADQKVKRQVRYYEVGTTGELAVGHRRYRLLLTQELRLREFRYRETETLVPIDFRQRRFLIKTGGGLRIGTYAGNGKSKASNLDITAFLLNATPALAARDFYENIESWRLGFGLTWWYHDHLGIHYEQTLSPINQFDLLGSNGRPELVRLMLIVRNDFFR